MAEHIGKMKTANTEKEKAEQRIAALVSYLFFGTNLLFTNRDMNAYIFRQ